uniref:ATP-dependent RNA helicase n=1 Tax=Panagrolaimus sp. PS1159 TaxID=55785 RepID=A0AC35F3B1_9BILA
ANCIPKIFEASDLAVDPYDISAVILTPTRELATQISDQFIAFGRLVYLQVCTVTGERDMMAQGNELSRQPHIVVATPNRSADYIESDPVTIGRLFKRIQYLVLDEAECNEFEARTLPFQLLIYNLCFES